MIERPSATHLGIDKFISRFLMINANAIVDISASGEYTAISSSILLYLCTAATQNTLLVTNATVVIIASIHAHLVRQNQFDWTSKPMVLKARSQEHAHI